jgi:hypothetical protein
VPEADRAIVAKYVSAWDAGVTRRFTELNDQVKPYQALNSDPQVLQEALFAYNLLNDDPEAVFRLLVANGIGQGEQQQNFPGGGDPQFQQQAPQWMQQQQQEWQLPPQFQQQWDQTQNVLQQLAQHVVSQQQQQQQAAEDAQLESYLTGLRTEFKPLIDQFGPFDEKWVLTALQANGGDGAKAVQDFYAARQQAVNQAAQIQQQAPVMLGGGGAPPAGDMPKPEQLSKNDTKSLVAQLVANAAANDK